MSIRKNLNAIAWSFLVFFLISGCGAVPAILGGVSVLGVEYTFSNKARKVYPIKKEEIRYSVTGVLNF